MAKLAKKVQKAAAVATVPGGDFPLLEPGRYVARLAKVEPRTSQAGNPTWNVEFDEITSMDGDKKPGRQWYNLNLPIDEMPEDYQPALDESAKEKKWDQYQSMTAGRIKGFFEAFGYSLDSDTDEMIGERCVVEIGIQTIQRGKRAGTDGNQINGLLSLEEGAPGFEEEGKSKDDF